MITDKVLANASNLAPETSTAVDESTTVREQVVSAVTLGALTSVEPKKFNRVRIPDVNGLSPVSDIEEESSLNISNTTKKKVLLNDEASLIQNGYQYPMRAEGGKADYSKMLPAKYDYRTGVMTTGPVSRLEEKLRAARAVLGLPVHGQSDIARTMRYFLYNRFKVPDKNMAHSRTFTHVFFTRPDLNILDHNGNIAEQCRNHTESSMIWARNPNLFRLLVDRSRTNDSDNFNLLLSNSITSFHISDEELTVNEAGRSWTDNTIRYGGIYGGRSGGEITIDFMDDKELSLVNMLKLWITYISNVSDGTWSPSYSLLGTTGQLSSSHVYTRTIDYAASIYVIKTSEDGSNILYWTKYYGVFPINTGASALSWDGSAGVGSAPRLSIRFVYSYKKDMSPVSLLEFNRCANIQTGSPVTYEPEWVPEYNHAGRPFVGTPFIEISVPTSRERVVGRATDQGNATIRLRFKPSSSVIGGSNGYSDKEIYS